MQQDLNQNLNSDLNQSTQNSSVSVAVSSSTSGSSGDFLSTPIGGVLTLVFIGLLGLLVLWIGILWLRGRFLKRKKIKDWKNTTILELAVPKENAEQVQKERAGGSQNADMEMMAIAEQIYTIMSDYNKNRFSTWFFGGERFSLEIISTDQEIKFWIACEKEISEVVSRQIVALYPYAHVEKVDRVDFFKHDTVAYAQELQLARRFELPFKTYKQMEGSEPLNIVTNAMGGLTPEESLGIQLILVPINEKWQEEPRELASRINQGQNPEDFLFPKSDYLSVFGSIFGFIGEVIGEIISPKKEDDPYKQDKNKDRRKIDITGRYDSIQLTQQQQEVVKKLEEKASKPGFHFTLRIVAAAANEARAKQIVNGMTPVFQIYDVRPFNWFSKVKINPKEVVTDFLLRAPKIRKLSFSNDNIFDIINTEEASSLWHLPNYLVKTPNIKWLPARKPSIPLNIPGPEGDNILVGTARSRGQIKDIYMQREDRFRHSYILGGSGSGKSILMGHMIMQDIRNGQGVCVIDPHGELIDEVLLRMPEERVDDVVLFSPAITDRPLGLNMLEFDPKKPTQKTLVIDTLFSIWDKLYDLKKTGGPMFESYMKNSMRLVMSHPESGATLMEINKILVDEDFRSFKLAMCEEQEVVDFWEKEAMKAGGDASLENMVPYITSKLAPFVTNDFLRPMVGQQKSAIQFRQGMDNNKIILVKLEKGLIGESSAYLVGMVILGNLLLSGMGRNDGLRYNLDGTTEEILAKDRTPFFVYIDEMQNFLFDAIPKALEEIRKYKVGFHLAHQFVKQVVSQGDERIKDSIMANCASKFIYRAGADDAGYLEKEFAPYFTAQDLMTPERFTYNTILLINGQKTTPFNVNGQPPDENINPELRKRIIEMTKQKYGKDRAQVEKEIKDRAKLLF